MEQDHPGASAFIDRHGKTRWRYRRKGKTIALPGKPGDPQFENAYQAAITGRAKPPAQVHHHPNQATPRSIGAAWRLVLRSPDWLGLDPATRRNQTRLAEAFLDSRIDPEHELLWRHAPIADLRRRHLKDLLSKHIATPHMAKHLLGVIRKMILEALDQEWIDTDPAYKLKWSPECKGRKPWPLEIMRQFEAKWPPGSKPRLVYALAFWLGNRRGDVAAVRWDERCTRTIFIAGELRQVDGFAFTQLKTDKQLFLPISPMLDEILKATPRRGETILVTAYGKAHSAKSLTNDMAEWTAEAGIEPGYTLHGLRKTLGKWLAEGGASTRQLMEVLGHDAIEHAELYSREAEQALLAVEGMDKVVALHKRRAG